MAQSSWSTLKCWTDVQTSVGGVVTFSPVDGTGIPIFSTILSAQFTGENASGVITAMPVCSLKAISGDRKTVTANVGTGTVLGLLGATMLGAPDGTKVHCLLMGN